MSRDRGPSNRAERAAELLTAYVDGVAELPPEERHHIEAVLARDPAVRTDETELRALVGKLRALPHEGSEPDWTAMAQSIHAAVGQDAPRPWWRSWRWLVPLTACATAAAVLLVIWPRLESVRDPSRSAQVEPAPREPAPREPAPREPAPREPAPRELSPRGDTMALWLDGAAVEVDLSAADLLDADEVAAFDEVDGAVALLPATNLGWVDRLDDEALSRVERWLESPTPTSPDSADSLDSLGRKKG